ncbi:MAG: endonuclease MutS2 [Acutalibacteraceae bacterium]|nr:endonuclease MutS2 [Acutalibacteraceae bacterium]
MYDCEKYYNLLELPAVLSLLSERATVGAAKDAALKLRPFADIQTVVKELDKTDEAYILSAKYASPSFGNPVDPQGLLTRAEVGAILNMSELLSVSECLRVIRTVKEWRNNISDSAVTHLADLFSLLSPNKFLEDSINSAIKSPEEMHDNASLKLADIRRKMRREASIIKDKLDSIVKNHGRAKYLQDAIVTQRDGRWVVPVKAEYKNEIPGIVHDTSSSGSTLFVEPMSVVESNNEIRVLMSEERDEIERILAELSAKVSDFSETIKISYAAITELNLVFAKADLAYRMKATMPRMNSSGRTVLKSARHPLIDRNKVVPISVALGVDYDTLVITGPNTGGKTVTLKTIGLLTLMAMCGLLIPADEGSEISFFDRILVDIGDEQSIQQSLSTFSSHMVNIIEILKESANKSLVLLDEVGGGTDPVEGAALAKSILITLSSNGAKTVATTHYPELKSYAIDTAGVENASCEFDVKTLKPTYRLLVGVPGKSNAFAISKKLGIPEEVVAMADSFIAEDERELDKVTEALERARQSAENERKKSEAMRIEAERALAKAERSLKEAEEKKEAILLKAKNDASYIIDNARYKSNGLLDELETMKKQLNAENATELYGKAKSSTKRTLEEIESASDPVADRSDEHYVLERSLIVGDVVRLSDLNKTATVEQISKDGARVLVAMGGLKTWTPITNLRLEKALEKGKSVPKTRNVTGVKSKAERDVKYEFDMRGMTVDEGIMELDRYIDGAVLAGIPSLTIIHGKGTGALRKAVHSYLKTNKNVITFRLGVFGEGEAGVTIAELKS